MTMQVSAYLSEHVPEMTMQVSAYLSVRVPEMTMQVSCAYLRWRCRWVRTCLSAYLRWRCRWAACTWDDDAGVLAASAYLRWRCRWVACTWDDDAGVPCPPSHHLVRGVGDLSERVPDMMMQVSAYLSERVPEMTMQVSLARLLITLYAASAICLSAYLRWRCRWVRTRLSAYCPSPASSSPCTRRRRSVWARTWDDDAGECVPVWARTWDDDAGVPRPPPHHLVRGVGDRVDVRRPLVDLASAVRLHVVLVVDVEGAVGVDRDRHLADVRVDLTLLIPAARAGLTRQSPRIFTVVPKKNLANSGKNRPGVNVIVMMCNVRVDLTLLVPAARAGLTRQSPRIFTVVPKKNLANSGKNRPGVNVMMRNVMVIRDVK